MNKQVSHKNSGIPTEDENTEKSISTQPNTIEDIQGSYVKMVDRENPHHYPRLFLSNGLSWYGTRLCSYGLTDDDGDRLVKQAMRIRDFEIREDDVLLAAYPKNGTHWLWEIVHMIVHNTTAYESRRKGFSMLEYCDLDDLAKEPSHPRVINSHLVPRHLPRQVMEKRIKIILLVRNFKDSIVSHYHHFKCVAEEGFTMDTHLEAIMDNKYLQWPNQFEYLRRMSEFRKDEPNQPVKVIYYEDMKQKPLEELQSMTKFLGLQRTDEFLRDVIVACSMENMKEANKKKETSKFMKRFPQGIVMYRKGIIGDWKNNLTVAQNEILDEFIKSEAEKGGLDYDFQYS